MTDGVTTTVPASAVSSVLQSGNVAALTRFAKKHGDDALGHATFWTALCNPLYGDGDMLVAWLTRAVASGLLHTASVPQRASLLSAPLRRVSFAGVSFKDIVGLLEAAEVTCGELDPGWVPWVLLASEVGTDAFFKSWCSESKPHRAYLVDEILRRACGESVGPAQASVSLGSNASLFQADATKDVVRERYVSFAERLSVHGMSSIPTLVAQAGPACVACLLKTGQVAAAQTAMDCVDEADRPQVAAYFVALAASPPLSTVLPVPWEFVMHYGAWTRDVVATVLHQASIVESLLDDDATRDLVHVDDVMAAVAGESDRDRLYVSVAPWMPGWLEDPGVASAVRGWVTRNRELGLKVADYLLSAFGKMATKSVALVVPPHMVSALVFQTKWHASVLPVVTSMTFTAPSLHVHPASVRHFVGAVLDLTRAGDVDTLAKVFRAVATLPRGWRQRQRDVAAWLDGSLAQFLVEARNGTKTLEVWRAWCAFAPAALLVPHLTSQVTGLTWDGVLLRHGLVEFLPAFWKRCPLGSFAHSKKACYAGWTPAMHVARLGKGHPESAAIAAGLETTYGPAHTLGVRHAGTGVTGTQVLHPK